MPLFAFYGVAAADVRGAASLCADAALYPGTPAASVRRSQLRRGKNARTGPEDDPGVQSSTSSSSRSFFWIGAPQDAIVRLFRTVPGPISPRRANCGVYGIHRNGRVLSRKVCATMYCAASCTGSVRNRSLAKEHGLPAKLPETARKKGNVTLWRRFTCRIGGNENRYALIANASASLILALKLGSREHRKVVGAIWPHALAQRAQKLRIRSSARFQCPHPA